MTEAIKNNSRLQQELADYESGRKVRPKPRVMPRPTGKLPPWPEEPQVKESAK